MSTHAPLAARGQRGFTLIELMTVVAIAIILLAVAVPSFKSVIVAQRMRTAAYDIVGDLVLARSEAVKRGASVVVEPAAGGWVQGWTVKVVSSAEVLHTRGVVSGSVTFSADPGTVTFSRDGRATFSNGTNRFALTDGGSGRRCISVGPSGQPKSVKQECPA